MDTQPTARTLQTFSTEYLEMRKTVDWTDPKAQAILEEAQKLVATTREMVPKPLLVLLEQEYRELKIRDLQAAKGYYFSQFLPFIVPIVEHKPCHARLRETEYTILVSTMGMSPETTVISTYIVRPKALLIILSSGEGASQGAEQAIEVLVRNGVVGRLHCRVAIVNEYNVLDIYEAIRKEFSAFISALRLDASQVAFDLTGGTKAMSAAGSIFTWQQHFDLLYLPGNWDPSLGMARLDSAYELVLLPDPGDQQGQELRRAGLEAWNKRDFNTAAASFHEASLLLRENLFDEIARDLSRSYLALLDLDQNKLQESLGVLQSRAVQQRTRALMRDAMNGFRLYIDAISEITRGDSTSILASLATLAELYRDQGRHGLAVLLSYRLMEQLVTNRLSRFNGFEMNKPNYQLLCDKTTYEELDERFRALRRDKPYPLPHDLGLVDGFILLVILDEVHERFWPELSLDELSAIGKLIGAGKRRNESIWGHGKKTMSADDSRHLAESASQLASALMDEFEHADFLARVHKLRPIDLKALMPGSH